MCKTLADLIDKALAEGQERVVIVAHGGTQMAALERFGVPRRSFHDWCGPNAGGFVLDAVFGDPAWLPHPVVYMGKAISALEKGLRARLPKTPKGELWGGRILAFCLPVGTFALTSLVCTGAAALHPLLGLAVQMFWCGQALAAKGLVQESTNVYRELLKPDLPAARIAVSRIVGRDTQVLTAEGVTKAAVETVAENASDGVIAPLLYMLLGGAPLALTYKAINTMDSMVGYKNTQYLYFGLSLIHI